SEKARDELCLLRQVPRRDVLLDDAPPRSIAEALRLSRIRQQPGHVAAESLEVLRVVDEDPAAAALDLVLDSADPAGHDRPRLEHRLGDSEPETFGKALLDHDRGTPLQRIDDRGVLVEVIHRQLRDENTRARLAGHRLARSLEVAKDAGL